MPLDILKFTLKSLKVDAAKLGGTKLLQNLVILIRDWVSHTYIHSYNYYLNHKTDPLNYRNVSMNIHMGLKRAKDT